MTNVQELYINQVGYLENDEKYFITTKKCNSFKLIDINQENIYEGKVELLKKDDEATGVDLYIGDFTYIKTVGEYKILLECGYKSELFKIGKEIFNDLLYKSLKSYYFQRCGTSLKENIVGPFLRNECHTGITEYHPSTGLEGGKDVTGGWHDAGDYGRYITPASIAVGIMMLGYEHFPEKYDFNHLGLSDSGNLNDFLGEMKYELDWMLKMQELDESSPMYGALHYMINSNKYTWNVPDKDNDKQYILDYSSVSTADFAAIMAFASRVYRDIDIRFSEIALERALIAWDFIIKNDPYPINGFQRPDGMITGGYAENGNDNLFKESDKLWPAVELYLTTGNDKFHTLVKKLFSKRFDHNGGMCWMDKSGFPEIQYALSKEPWIDIKLQKKIKKRFLNRCDNFLKISKEDGFGIVLDESEYQWGSNGEVLKRALELVLAYVETDNDEYRVTALKQLNYILGLNINSMSFVAGVGTNYPKNIHHASFDNDGIGYCFPGMMTGGPNRAVEADKILSKEYKEGTPGARCYIDHKGSYSSNENCITYSAPLVPLAAFFSFC